MKVLVLLPLSGQMIAPFTKPFVPGFIAGFHAIYARLKAFGEHVPDLTIDVVDLAAQANNQNKDINQLKNAAREACKVFTLDDYSVLVSGTSPISNELFSESCGLGERFTAPHFLVAFDKDIVQRNRNSSIRLLPHYGLEFVNFVQLLSEHRTKSCLFVGVDDDASNRLFKDLEAISKTLRRTAHLDKLMLAWDVAQWQFTAETMDVMKRFDFLILAVYSYQLKTLADQLMKLDGKIIFVNIDGIDLVNNLEKEVSSDLVNFVNCVKKFNPRTHAASWNFSRQPKTLFQTPVQEEIKVNFFDCNHRILDKDSSVFSDKLHCPSDSINRYLLNKYVAGYAFDTACISVIAEQKRIAEQKKPHNEANSGGERLEKKHIVDSLPFQGVTGTVIVDDAGDLSSPLRFADMELSNGNLRIKELDSIFAQDSGDLLGGKHQPSISSLVKAFVGSSIVPTDHVCFLDVAYNDQQTDGDEVHWIVAAPSVESITQYKEAIKQVGEEHNGHLIGNHPSVLALLPRLKNRFAVSAEELESLGSDPVPIYRVPETLEELKNLHSFIDNRITNSTNWSIELIEYLTSVLPPPTDNTDKKHPCIPKFSAMVATESKLRYSDLKCNAPVAPPALSNLWRALGCSLAEKRDNHSCFRSSSGNPLQRIYMCPIYFHPREDQCVSGYPSDDSRLGNYRIAQVYLGIGWPYDDNGLLQKKAEQEALNILESVRALLLEHATVERLEAKLRKKISEAQYAAQAHEIKRIRRHIHSDSPPFILELIRNYFNSLFASGMSVEEIQVIDSTSSHYYLGYGQGKNLGDFVANAIKIAVQIELLDDWSRQFVGESSLQYGGTPWPEDCKLRMLSDNEVQKMQSIFRWSEESLKSVSVTSIKKTERFHFFGALVCLLRNVVRYCDREYSINVKITGRSIQFRNHKHCGFRNATKHESVGRTAEAVRYFVRNYAPSREGVISMGLQVDSRYISIIPIPEDLTINA